MVAERDLARLPEINAGEAILPVGGAIPINEVKLRFLLRVSEELRSPLAVLTGYLDMIQDGTISDPLEAMPILVGKAGELNRVISELLQRARDEQW